MNFCTNCGTKAEEENQKFCKSCGFSFPKEVEEISPNSTEPIVKNEGKVEQETSKSVGELPNEQGMSNDQVETATKSVRRNNKKKWMLFSVIAILGILIITHFTIKSSIDPVKTVKAMDEDFQKENKKDFLKHFTYSSKVHVDEEGFYDYVEEQSWSELRSNMLSNIEIKENGGLTDPILDNNGNKFVRFVQEPIFGGLYTKISFELVPTQVKIAAEFSEVDFSIESESIQLTNDMQEYIGEFLPGKYKWDAVINEELGSIPFDGELEVGQNADNNEEIIQLDLQPKYSRITTNNDEATLLVNGKAVDESFYGEVMIGPLPLDGSVTVQAEVVDGGKKYKTDEIKVKKEDITLEFEYLLDQQAQQEADEALSSLVDENYDSIQTFYQDFRDAYESDVNNHKYNALPSYVVSGSEIDKVYEGYFEDFKEGDEIDNHSNYLMDLKAIDETTFTFNTEEEYTFYSHKGTTIDYRYKKVYTIVTSGNNYKVKEIDSKKVSEKEYD